MTSVQLTIINIIVYNILAMPLLFSLFGNGDITRRYRQDNKFFLWLLIIYFCLYPVYSGDWIHYREKVEYLSAGSLHSDSLEDIYLYIIDFIGNQYLLFRLIVWGFALFILRKLLIRHNMNTMGYIRLFALWNLIYFAYPRVSAGLVLALYGYSLLVKPSVRKARLCQLVGILIILISLFFHKSMLIFVGLMPFSFIDLTRTKLFLILCFNFVLVYILEYVFDSAMVMRNEEDLEYLNTLTREFSLGEIIRNVLLYGSLIAALVILIYNYSIKNEFRKQEYWVKRFYCFTVDIGMFALILSLSDIDNVVLLYRCFNMIYLPFLIILGHYMRRKTFAINIISVFALLGGNCLLLYSLMGHINGSIQ